MGYLTLFSTSESRGLTLRIIKHVGPVISSLTAQKQKKFNIFGLFRQVYPELGPGRVQRFLFYNQNWQVRVQ